MPAVHYQTFQARYYECDAYGHLNNITYLRWMQEAAFGASAAVGYDFARYDEISHLWLVRETDIEYLVPIKYGDEVEIKTWVKDFRRFRSRRMYEFTDIQTKQLAARASTDWVYLSAETLRPAVIPTEMQQAFFPEGVPEESISRDHFPSPPPPPPNVFSIRRQVEWRDIDMMWHVNNAAYLSYIEDAGTHVGEAFGWPMQRMSDAGFGLIARRHQIEYRQPAKLGDELEIATWYSGGRRASATRYYTIRRLCDDTLLAQAQTLWVGIDLKTGRPIRMPEHFLDDFAENLARKKE
jgi:acyl-CoA thioester hydrolase